jgi:hypothetical protein
MWIGNHSSAAALPTGFDMFKNLAFTCLMLATSAPSSAPVVNPLPATCQPHELLALLPVGVGRLPRQLNGRRVAVAPLNPHPADG